MKLCSVRLKKEPVVRTVLKPGFTLIELLVVIAIIALLAAILFPVFARARENARRISCLSNQKQIGLAFMQYSQDYDERLPPYTGNDQVSRSDYAGLAQYGWAVLLDPYAKSVQVFQCPSDKVKPGIGTSGNYSDYVYNYNIGVTPGVITVGGVQIQPSKSVKLAEFSHVSNTIMTWDATTIYSPYGTSFWYMDEYTFKTYAVDAPGGHPVYDGHADSVRRHLEGANYVFADGHAKWIKPSQLASSYNATPNGSNYTLRIK
jgi:prepilin-type N-terminal cleavage/methylation domain-containing protein/prepilin-type processing-associated H-X9-DG protein